MKRIEKEDLVIILSEKYGITNIQDDYKKYVYLRNITTFVDNLYNRDEEKAMPLSKIDTYILRRKYGVFDEGFCRTQASIADELGVTHTRIYERIKRCHKKIYNYTVKYVKFVDLDGNVPKDDLPIFIEEMNLCTRSYNALKREGLVKVEDIIKLSTKELSKIKNLGEKCIEEVIDKVHGYNYTFADEISKEDFLNPNKPKMETEEEKLINYVNSAIQDKETKKLVTRYINLKREKHALDKKRDAIDEEIRSVLSVLRTSTIKSNVLQEVTNSKVYTKNINKK